MSSSEAEATPAAQAAPTAAAAAASSSPPPSLTSPAAPGSPAFVHCKKCNKDIPAADWANHKDNLEKVQLREQTLSFFQLYVLMPILDAFLWVLANVFFREIAIVGASNVPRKGAVVFYGNHQNQFMDALVMRAACGRPVRFVIAEKSMHRPVIGQFAQMMQCVPVVRPQDVPTIPGTGELTSVACATVTGSGTQFTKELAYGDVVSWKLPSGRSCQAQIVTILSDTSATVSMAVATDDELHESAPFRVSKRIDQSEMYAKVYSALAKGDTLGIFPEGGSHDRTSLQPLKAGVALFTLGARERGIDVSVVPVGLTYFFGHKFRSRVHVEFGAPFRPSTAICQGFAEDKRRATGDFLQVLDKALRAVTINVPDWATLKFLHSFRRLYQPPDVLLNTGEYLALTRRLANIIASQERSADMSTFRLNVENYNDYLAAVFMRDSQAATLGGLKVESVTLRLLFRRLVVLCVLGIVLLPLAVIGGPIGVLAHVLAEAHAKIALKGSAVKVIAADVKASYKIVVGFVLVPIVFTTISAIVWYFNDVGTALTVLLALPMSLFVSLQISRDFVMEGYATLPLVLSMVSKHKQFMKLYEKRLQLVKESSDIVKKYDAELHAQLEGAVTSVQRYASLFSLRHRSRRESKEA